MPTFTKYKGKYVKINEQYKSGKIGLVSTCYPRLEIDFIEEFLEYYRDLGIDKVFLYVDTRQKVSDRIFDQGNEPTNIWSKKPNFDYKLEYDYDTIHKVFKDKVNKFGDFVEVKEIVRDDFRIDGIQSFNIYDCILDNNLEFEWLLNTDIDEFFVDRNQHFNIRDFIEDQEFDYDKHITLHIPQIIMDKRYDSPGKNRKTVFDITETKGYNRKYCLDWKPIFNIYSLMKNINKVDEKLREIPQLLLHFRSFETVSVNANNAVIFHFCGWKDQRHENRHLDYQKLMSYNTDEHIKYRELLSRKKEAYIE